MPLVRVSLLEGKSDSFKQKVADSIHQAMVETINVPPLDKFQVFTDHSKSGSIHAPQYPNNKHTVGLSVIQITLNTGRTVEMKKALYKRIADLLAESVQVRPEDVLINLVEVPKENWSFGNGIAQYAT